MIREVVGIRLGGAGVLALIPIALLLPGLLRKPPSPYSLYSGLNCDVYLEECPQVEPGPFQMEVNEAGSPSIPSDMLPMWEVGFSRVCCDVHPRSYLSLCVGLAFLGDDRCNVREQGDGVVGPVLGDVQYADEIERMSQPGAIVYVSQGQLLQFVDAFVQLPPTASLILVTGHTDCSFPRQQWGEGVDNRLCFLIDSKEDVEARIHYTELIQDSRLRHWFTQNYDLTGCNAASGCSPWSRDQAWTNKVTPIPIGFGIFERYAEQLFWIKAHERKSMRKQVSDLLDVRERSHRFDLKQQKLLLAFSGDHGRQSLLDLLLGRPYVEHYSSREWWEDPGEYPDRLDYWRALAKHMFVAAPSGLGMDTYRVWEALFLGSVPVVLSSTLDLLYQDYPIIIIDSWESINATSLSRWQLEIVQRFGPQPSARVQEKLTMQYWVDVVQRAADRSRALSPLDLGQNNLACDSAIVRFCHDPW
mmetsp:Transcript_80154/g.194353  ORF Transcript_80154/g.194353 Transcript_80154/m.194353 type:complete len:473 (-) Transcript_80154:41-1459(-)